MILLALTGAALASVPTDRFPVVAEVTLPESGPARIHVPPELRSAADPPDGSDLLLVDALGREVPFARLTDDARWEAVAEPVSGVATSEPMLWTVHLGPTPIDGLEVILPGSQAAATVTIEDMRGRPLSEPTLVWTLSSAHRRLVPLERAASGRMRVRVQPHAEGLQQAPDVVGVRLTNPGVPDDRMPGELSAPRNQGNGWWRYDLALDRPLPVSAVHLQPADATVRRRAGLQAAPLSDPAGQLLWNVAPTGPQLVERVALEGVVIEDLDVPLSGAPSDRLTLLVEEGSGPLDLDTVTVELAGVHLLAHDAGPGPHRLYAGAPPGTNPPSDLVAATPELARGARTAVDPDSAAPNPEWIPPEARGELGAPGRELDAGTFAWSRAVQGAGLSRIVLPPQVLAESREDLGDLRLEADGREVPYLIRRRAAEEALPNARYKTHRRDGETVLEIVLDDPELPVAAVTLHTEAPVFQRRVSVARPRGDQLEFLRAVQWHGTGGPSSLTVALGHRIGDTLVVTLDDGDNPPLPISDVSLTTPAWEMVAVVPSEGEVCLLSGDPDRTTPRYDLALVSEELRHRPLADATLGEVSAIQPPPLSWLDRLLVAGGLGVLCIGLLGLLRDVLRSSDGEGVDAPAV